MSQSCTKWEPGRLSYSSETNVMYNNTQVTCINKPTQKWTLAYLQQWSIAHYRQLVARAINVATRPRQSIVITRHLILLLRRQNVTRSHWSQPPPRHTEHRQPVGTPFAGQNHRLSIEARLRHRCSLGQTIIPHFNPAPAVLVDVAVQSVMTTNRKVHQKCCQALTVY